jgi:hypothetical protein
LEAAGYVQYTFLLPLPLLLLILKTAGVKHTPRFYCGRRAAAAAERVVRAAVLLQLGLGALVV